MNELDLVHYPYWNAKTDLPSFLEDIAAQMRRGDYTPSSECLVLTKDMAYGFVTISRWGEDDGLSSEDTLLEIAKVSRTTA